MHPAASTADTVIITPDALHRLCIVVTGLSVALADADAGDWRTPDTVAAQLREHHLTAEQLIPTYAAPAVRSN